MDQQKQGQQADLEKQRLEVTWRRMMGDCGAVLTEPELHEAIIQYLRDDGLGHCVMHENTLRRHRLICDQNGNPVNQWPDFILTSPKGLIGLEVKATTKTRELRHSYELAIRDAKEYSRRNLHVRTKTHGILPIWRWAGVGDFVQFSELEKDDPKRDEILSMKQWAWAFLRIGVLSARIPNPPYFYRPPWGISYGRKMATNVKFGALKGGEE